MNTSNPLPVIPTAGKADGMPSKGLARTILDERILRFILTLAEELHFGNASKRLHVSQSGLSGTVKNLERALGIQLFKRTSRLVELTEAGRVFVDEARELVDHAERAIAKTRGRAADFSGPLRIGYPPTIDLRWFCSMVSQARSDSHLATSIELISAETVELQNDLTKGTLNAAFLSGRVSNPELEYSRLFRERFTVAMGSGHSLANRAKLAVEQLQQEPVVWLRRDLNPLFYDSFLASCSAQGYRPRIVQEVKTFAECLHFAREGLGITFLPQSMGLPEHDRAIVFGTLPKPLYLDLTLVFRRDDRAETLKRFVKFVQHHVPAGVG